MRYKAMIMMGGAIAIISVLGMPYLVGWASWVNTTSPKFCAVYGGWIEPIPCNEWQHCDPPVPGAWARVAVDGRLCSTGSLSATDRAGGSSPLAVPAPSVRAGRSQSLPGGGN